MVAVYNDEGLKKRLWLVLKKLYSRSRWPLKKLLELVTFKLTWGKAFMFKPRKAVKKLVQLRAQTRHVPWRDLLDWAGGYPCEFSNAGDVFTFFRQRGFPLETLRTVHGLTLNEFVFQALPRAICRIEHETNGPC
jgi:hypothetical protein